MVSNIPAQRDDSCYRHNWVCISVEPVLATVLYGKLHIVQDPQADRRQNYGCYDCPEMLTKENIDDLCPVQLESANLVDENKVTRDD